MSNTTPTSQVCFARPACLERKTPLVAKISFPLSAGTKGLRAICRRLCDQIVLRDSRHNLKVSIFSSSTTVSDHCCESGLFVGCPYCFHERNQETNNQLRGSFSRCRRPYQEPCTMRRAITPRTFSGSAPRRPLRRTSRVAQRTPPRRVGRRSVTAAARPCRHILKAPTLAPSGMRAVMATVTLGVWRAVWTRSGSSCPSRPCAKLWTRKNSGNFASSRQRIDRLRVI